MPASTDYVTAMSVWMLHYMMLLCLELAGITIPSFPLPVLAEAGENTPVCSFPASVCGTALRISDSTTISESPYCNCTSGIPCGQDWNSDDEFNAFTWYHHERMDWVVQYLFCSTDPLSSGSLCDSLAEMDEIVSVIRVKKIHKKNVANYLTTWLPYLHRHDCKCRDGRYHMHSWMLVKEGEEKDDDQYWEYNYTCDMQLCKRDEPCDKHYMDQSSTHAIGYRFICSCPEGQYCPSGKEEKIKKYDVDDVDETGPYLWGHCLPILGWDTGEKDGQD